MNHRIEIIPERNLVGIRLSMSFAANRTGDLWKAFMQRRHDVENRVGVELYSLQIYDPGYFSEFSPERTFEKWAAVQVTDFSRVPPAMESLVLPAGKYAVFSYKGSSADGGRAFHYIFTVWLPDSGYVLDDRPHFECLGLNYKNNDKDSEEEIWIPVRTQE